MPRFSRRSLTINENGRQLRTRRCYDIAEFPINRFGDVTGKKE
jgi:hypothetical protein